MLRFRQLTSAAKPRQLAPVPAPHFAQFHVSVDAQNSSLDEILAVTVDDSQAEGFCERFKPVRLNCEV
jgi:hypothetical protein